jgi:hypothetical protein
MGCDHADVVAAILSFAGATWNDPAQCAPVAPVHALEIHSTGDMRFAYGGGCDSPEGGCYPSALATAQTWADLNHCTSSSSTPVRLDLTATVPGADTSALTYGDCEAGGSAGLWTVMDAPHHPELSPSFNDLAVQYLLSRPKPSDIPCADVASVQAQCGQNGVLVIDARFTSAAHDGKTVDVDVDGSLRVAPVSGFRARLALPGQSPGAHLVRLVEPVGCAADVSVNCAP